MTVRELIEQMSKQDQDLPVVYCDWTHGYMLVSEAYTTRVEKWDGNNVPAVLLDADTGL